LYYSVIEKSPCCKFIFLKEKRLIAFVGFWQLFWGLDGGGKAFSLEVE